MNRQSFTKLLLPILSFGLIKRKEEDKPIVFKETNNQWGTIGVGFISDGKGKLISIHNYLGTSNNGEWVVYKVHC